MKQQRRELRLTGVFDSDLPGKNAVEVAQKVDALELVDAVSHVFLVQSVHHVRDGEVAQPWRDVTICFQVTHEIDVIPAEPPHHQVHEVCDAVESGSHPGEKWKFRICLGFVSAEFAIHSSRRHHSEVPVPGEPCDGC